MLGLKMLMFSKLILMLQIMSDTIVKMLFLQDVCMNQTHLNLKK